jgi:hypothetical protein
MKKVLFIFAILSMFANSASLAQKPDKEFKKLFKETVTKMSAGSQDTVEFRVFRLNKTAVTRMVYEKSHSCLCNDKLCHGPRLTLSANFGRTSIFIFPNGYCFAATNNFNPGADIVSVDIRKEAASEASFKEAAKKTLLDYVTYYQ